MAVAAEPSTPKRVTSPGVGRLPFQIPSLDGLRAVSFLMVFAAHAGVDAIPGGFGVTVFFFLSGYLITTLMRLEAEKTGRVSLKNFYSRRALRILPPFYIVLFAATTLAATGFLHVREDGLPRLLPVTSQILHFSNYWIAFHGWTGIAPGTGVYWSLAVEEHFYIVFPTAFLALSRFRLTGKQKAFAFWGLCALVLAWRCVLVIVVHAPADRTFLCSDTRVDSMAFGCALAVWNNPALDGIGGPPPESDRSMYLLLLGGVGTLLATFLIRDPVFRETFRYTLQGMALTPVFVAAVRWPNWPPFRILNLPPLRFVGTLSYTLYLVHHTALFAVEAQSQLRGFARAFVALVVSLAVAWAMHVVVERPCAKLRRRLSATGMG
jgi:peptidoglycan/LPS O-acetylase OafA/YrhL